MHNAGYYAFVMTAMLKVAYEKLSASYCLKLIPILFYVCGKYLFLFTLHRVSGLSASRCLQYFLLPRVMQHHNKNNACNISQRLSYDTIIDL